MHTAGPWIQDRRHRCSKWVYLRYSSTRKARILIAWRSRETSTLWPIYTIPGNAPHFSEHIRHGIRFLYKHAVPSSNQGHMGIPTRLDERRCDYKKSGHFLNHYYENRLLHLLFEDPFGSCKHAGKYAMPGLRVAGNEYVANKILYLSRKTWPRITYDGLIGYFVIYFVPMIIVTWL